MTYTLFVIDDEETIREGMATVLGSEYRILTFADAESGIQAMAERTPDLVLLDIGLPGMDGVAALEVIRENHPETVVIMITAYEDVQTVIKAMKLGAYDYVIKPLQMDSLELTIDKALETISLRREVKALQEQCLKEQMPFFVGESDVIQDVMGLVKLVAKSPDTPILILGETGTGKELIARALHYRSPNFQGSLVTMNCASLPGDLVESELFGYEKGAFTGASSTGKRGLIEEAAGGTLFLDEVGDLSLSAQAKLLRFLEEGEFYRVGGVKKIHVKTRVISATNRDLELMMEDGRFRPDLYYRLGVIKVEMPSLNQRQGDIEQLARFFLDSFNRKFSKSITGFTDEASAALKNHQWTGNIRELRNVVERAVLIGQQNLVALDDLGLAGSASPADLAAGHALPAIPPEGLKLDEIAERVEAFYLREALRLSDGNESAAARLLGLNHHTFRYRLKKLADQ